MPREKVERPADKAVRRANLRRIGRLFRPYWAQARVVTVLILLASALGVVPAFLQQAVFTQAFIDDAHERRSSSTCGCSSSSSSR